MIEELKLEEKVASRENYRVEPPKEKKTSIWDKMFRKNKLKKPSTVAVVYLRTNGVAEPMEVQTTKDGFFNINGRTYHEDRDCVYRFKSGDYPFAIIPEWNVTPLGRKSWEDKLMQEKFATLQDHVMKGIRHAERVRMGEGSGMQLNPKTLVILGILAIIAIAFIMGYT